MDGPFLPRLQKRSSRKPRTRSPPYQSGHLAGKRSQNEDFEFDVSADHSGAFSDGTPYQEHLTITGRLSGTTATGTLLETLMATIEGTAESCTSNPQT
jgi:hypothetical protein